MRPRQLRLAVRAERKAQGLRRASQVVRQAEAQEGVRGKVMPAVVVEVKTAAALALIGAQQRVVSLRQFGKRMLRGAGDPYMQLVPQCLQRRGIRHFPAPGR